MSAPAVEPGGRTRCFAVIGHPVAHSLSPAMHNASLRSLGWDALYLAFDVGEAQVAAALAGLRCLGFGGVNVTLPLKHAACRAMNRLAPCASRLGVVNTVAFDGPDSVGYNTDGVGLLTDLAEQFAVHPRGLRVLVVGCGGAGRAAALTLAAEGAASLALANRTARRAAEVAADVAVCAPETPVRALSSAIADWVEAARDADLVVQCSTSGMHAGDAPVLPAAAFRTDQCLYDLVYTAEQTSTMQVAARQGARVANGLGMLLHQGAESFRIWTDVRPDVPAMRSALHAAMAARTGGESPNPA